MRIGSALILVLLFSALAAGAGETIDWLPDVTVDEVWLHDTEVVDNIEPGHIHLRLSNATPNIGLGPVYVYGVFPAHEDGSQDIMQRVFRSDGSYFDRPAGRFVFHSSHDHIHVEDWASYRLRERLFDGSPGKIVAQSVKTSYCLRDSRVYDDSLPNFVARGDFQECETVIQGISVGHEDLYVRQLPDQWIDITGLPQGEYWLESVVDPDDHILESDETNNVARAPVTLGEPVQHGLLYFLMQFIQLLFALLRSLLGLPPA